MKSRFRLFSLALASLALSGCVVVPPRHYGGPPQALWLRASGGAGAVCRSGAGDAPSLGPCGSRVRGAGRAGAATGCPAAGERRAMAAGTGTESVELVQ